jgi:hypothetical protein
MSNFDNRHHFSRQSGTMGRGEAPIITDVAHESSDYDGEISDIQDDAHSFAENAMASTISNLESILRPVSNIKRSLIAAFDVKNMGYRNCPQCDEDLYRNFSISRVAPSIRLVAEIRRPTPYPYVSKHAGCDH